MKKIILIICLVLYFQSSYGYNIDHNPKSLYKGCIKYSVGSSSYGDYDKCVISTDKNFSDGVDNYNAGKYINAIENFLIFMEINGLYDTKDYSSAANNLELVISKIVNNDKNDLNKVVGLLTNFINADFIYDDGINFYGAYNLGIIYFQLGDYDNSMKYFNIAKTRTKDNAYILKIDSYLKKNNIKKANLNDPYSYLQFYLSDLNIINAWKKVKNNNQVVVAVIDSGVYTEHPDLINNIWIPNNFNYGDNKNIDFTSSGGVLGVPSSEHGTMVSGIIGAEKNNNEGIAGISNNVKIMPLKVISGNGASNENVIKAINYAIDNGANIINLSLGGTQFRYTTDFDVAIKRAFDSGVIVVIAAGNGDVMSSQQNGLNLDISPVSPVCNNENKYKYSIGVYATDENGYRTNWTNYGKCSPFFAPGVGIVSTTIPIFSENSYYNKEDGTSFSAPIVTGIVALGYNQYGYVNPVDIYDALEESKVNFTLPDGQTGYKIDASKYIDVLGIKLQNTINQKSKIENENKLKQQQIESENKLKQKAEKVFNQLKSKFSKYSIVNRKNKYNSILKQLNGYNGKLQGDNAIILNHLIYLINQELKNIQ